jgi:hypothetical protein
MNLRRIGRVIVGTSLLLLPVAAWAQTAASGTIAGVVRDPSGAVLPGVTVEAASPVLIEKARTVVTDGQGLYRIVDLRPGTYIVTFTLSGFSTFRREGIELSASFTATVNADLAVGALEETVVISGAAPVVDIQNVVQQRTLGRDALDQLPNTRTFGAYAMLIPGAVQAGGGGEQNVGGVGGNSSTGAGEFAIHGGRPGDINLRLDGMSLNMQGNGTGSNFSVNHAAIQEVVVETSGVSADSESGGVKLNFIPREGGNIFSGYASFIGANGALQAENLSEEQQAIGLTTSEIRQAHDVSGGVGGPIMRNKLWFYTAHRRWGSSAYAAGKFFALDPKSPIYTPDTSRPAYNDFYYRDHSARVTWQAAQKHRINSNYAKQVNCQCFIRLDFELRTPEASGNHMYNSDLYQSNWVYTATNRLLFEAGVTHLGYNQDNQRTPGVGPDDIAITELSTGLQYRARANTVTGTNGNYSGPNGITAATRNTNVNVAASYVTGSHSLKSGLFVRNMSQDGDRVINGGMDFNFRNGIPQRVRLFAQPYLLSLETAMNAFYVQDQWTVRRLTMNLGLRYDYFNGHVPATRLPAGALVGERNFPEVNDAPKWNDLSTRIGAAYDLFGNGRTAIKGFVGRYLAYQGVGGLTASAAPVNLLVVSATRTWTDTNGNFMPDCSLVAPAANAECGPLNPANFGENRVATSTIADDVFSGWGARPANWQASLSMQHELRPGLAVNVGYFRTWYQNFTVNDNVPVAATDYDDYCITAPTDPRLPGGGGNQICGLFDIVPSKFGQNFQLQTQAANYGQWTEAYDGVDVTLNVRYGTGGTITGGVATGRTATNTCEVGIDPSLTVTGVTAGTSRSEEFCNISPPWSAGTQLKLAVVQPLFWDIQASAMYQNLPGLMLQASQEVPNSQIAPSLGRNLSQGANGSVAIDLIPQGTAYLDRRNQLDLRFSRPFQFGRFRLQANADIYNVFNSNYSITYNETYGPEWQLPQTFLNARLVKLGVNLNF